MASIKELTSNRANLIAENRKLLKAAKDEERDLTDAEKQKWDENDAEISRLSAEIESRSASQARDDRLSTYDAIEKTAPPPGSGPPALGQSASPRHGSGRVEG